MAAESRFVGNSIEELLVALAEGVREAQSALNSGPLVDPAGRPLAVYQLPFLDFSIQVDMETRTDQGGRPVALLFTAKQASAVQQVSSTISGRLVSIPPGEGLPVPRIAVQVGGNIGGDAAVTLTVTNSAGEQLPNQRVELNIDDADSAALSAARGAPGFVRQPGTRVRNALLTTDAQGRAVTSLLVARGEPAKALVMIVASIGPVSTQAAVPLEEVG